MKNALADQVRKMHEDFSKQMSEFTKIVKNQHEEMNRQMLARWQAQQRPEGYPKWPADRGIPAGEQDVAAALQHHVVEVQQGLLPHGPALERWHQSV